MFLKNIHIKNYRSLKDSQISFKEGLNIVIGKNGAGKSNLLGFILNSCRYETFFNFLLGKKFFDLFDTTIQVSDGNEIVTEFKILQQTNSTHSPASIDTEVKISEIVDGQKKLVYEQVLKTGANWNTFEKYRDFIKQFQTLLISFVNFTIPDSIRWFNLEGKLDCTESGIIVNEYYEATFRFLHEFLFSIKEVEFGNSFKLTASFQDFVSSNQLNEHLARLTPIDEIRLNEHMRFSQTEDQIIVDNLFIEFKLGKNWVPWSHLSDGTKRLFFIISECISNEHGLLLIEEPELGIHPHQLHLLMQFLKEQSAYKQIIISTHSPQVLNVLNSDELDRINIATIGEKGTKFQPLSADKIALAKKYMQELELSDYWLHSDLEEA